MMQVASSSSATTPLGGHAPKKMGLLPLEFADCLIDSPYFRENLKSHEKQLDQTSADIKGIIRDIQVRKMCIIEINGRTVCVGNCVTKYVRKVCVYMWFCKFSQFFFLQSRRLKPYV